MEFFPSYYVIFSTHVLVFFSVWTENTAPVFSVTGEIQVEVGKSYDNVLTATATDADTGTTLTYSLINAPQVGQST